VLLSNIAAQSTNNLSILSPFPNSLIDYEFDLINNEKFSYFNGVRPLIINNNNYYNLNYNYQAAFNVGHPNVDNNAEFFALNGLNKIFSTQFSYRNKWVNLFVEPYLMDYGTNIVDAGKAKGSYEILNNHYYNSNDHPKTQFGIRQSGLIIHYNGLGIGYFNSSQWWGPSFHSSISMTSNSPSMKSYVLGTFNDINIKNLSFGFRAILIPYKNQFDWPIYFSGLSSYITLNSDPTITLGIFRTYLSGNLINLSEITSLENEWTAMDAFKLIFEPLFGTSKSGLDYTTPNTPGFDPWDQTLTGFINISFPKDNLKVYFEVASDDNRANLTDLKAHWDHTLGYMLGFRKYYSLSNYRFLIGSEYLSTKKSNTDKFWRHYTNNFYSREVFNFFSYKGRRIGAHSGSNSDDFIIISGIEKENSKIFISYNKERHGINTFDYPEQKTELMFTLKRKLSTYHSAFITLEFEHIRNFGFVQRENSESKLLWIGYTFSIK
jgi:hypothetical protein